MSHNGHNIIYALDTCSLEAPAVFQNLYEQMPPERRKKIDRFRFAKDQRLSLGAGILLQKGLRQFGATGAAIAYEPNGKPFLLDRNDLHFNLSHSKSIAVCAFSDRPVGIDVEGIRNFDNALADLVFHREEYPVPFPSDQIMTTLWTIKESVMKYFGTGLMLEPKQLLVRMTPTVSVHCQEYPCEKLHFTHFETSGCVITVCSEYASFARELVYIHPEELLI